MKQTIITYLITAAGGGVGSIVLSAAIRALPEPLQNGSRFYLFFYRFSNLLLANKDRSDAAKEIVKNSGNNPGQ